MWVEIVTPPASSDLIVMMLHPRETRKVESEMDRGVFVSRAEAEKTTLNEALEHFIAEYIPKLKEVKKG
jgi:hypothetical protein